jgi:hypothetical protein
MLLSLVPYASQYCTLHEGFFFHHLYLYLVDLRGGIRKWVVRPMGLKRWVVRPVRISLQVRELLGIDFLRESNYNYSALRLLIHLVVEAMERKWGSQRTVEIKGDPLLRVLRSVV